MTDQKTIDHLLLSIQAKAGAIQIDADSKEHSLDWSKVHAFARDISLSIWEIRERLGYHRHENSLLELTAMLDEHPIEWDGPCMCKSCLGE